MKYYKEFTIENSDNYKSAKEIAEIYNIISPTSFGGGPKAAANIKKFLLENNIEYNDIFRRTASETPVLVYPECIYDKAVKAMLEREFLEKNNA